MMLMGVLVVFPQCPNTLFNAFLNIISPIRLEHLKLYNTLQQTICFRGKSFHYLKILAFNVFFFNLGILSSAVNMLVS